MVESGIFATRAEVLRKAGWNVSASGSAEADTNDYLTQVESFINVYTRHNWSDEYSSLNADTKGILKEIATNLAAIYCIQFNMGVYNSRVEAEDMINVLRDAALRGLAVLRDKTNQQFLKDQTPGTI